MGDNRHLVVHDPETGRVVRYYRLDAVEEVESE